MIRMALILSLLLNVGMAGVLVFMHARGTQNGPPQVVAAVRTGAPAVEPPQIEAPAAVEPRVALQNESILASYQSALADGLEAESAKMLLAYSLFRRVSIPVGDKYWEAPVKREYERQAAQIAAYDAARALIVEALGAQASDDPIFEFLFKPLQDRLPFLSSAKQQRIQQLKVNAQHELLSSSGVPGQFGRGQAVAAELAADLQRLLTPKEYFEYQLRDSPTAQMLSASSFNFSEAEFRGTFRVVSKTGPTPTFGSMVAMTGQPTVANPTLNAIKEVLGPQRFQEYRRAQDPTFKLLLSIASARRMQADAAIKAYEILDTAAQQRLKLNLHGPVMTGAQRSQLQHVMIERDGKLKAALGADGFMDLSRMLEGGVTAMVPGNFMR